MLKGLKSFFERKVNERSVRYFYIKLCSLRIDLKIPRKRWIVAYFLYQNDSIEKANWLLWVTWALRATLAFVEVPHSYEASMYKNCSLPPHPPYFHHVAYCHASTLWPSYCKEICTALISEPPTNITDKPTPCGNQLTIAALTHRSNNATSSSAFSH